MYFDVNKCFFVTFEILTSMCSTSMVKFNIFSLMTEKRRETRHLPLQALNVASLAAKL